MLAGAVPAHSIRLLWGDPNSPAPAWAAHCLDLPAAGDAVGSAPADDTVLLLLDPTLATPGRCWLLTEGNGMRLHLQHPLVHCITGGHGIDLALWQRPSPLAPWSLLRMLHVASPARYGKGKRLLPQAVARLLRQAAVEARLPSLPQVRSLRTAQQPEPQVRPTSAPLRLLQRLRGVWLQHLLHWRQRWLCEAWQIGVIDQPLTDWALGSVTPPVRWLPTPPGEGYWADPMADGISNEHLLCEYFNDVTGRGHIERLALGPQGVTDRQTLPLGQGQHASFPLVQTIGGRRIGVVETAALGLCQLHEVADDGSWRVIATPLQGVAAADPALFEWEGRFWLAYTDIGMGAVDNLCLHHAPALEGPWEAHANNPVKVDVTGARMAGGLFWHEGALYRPAQNCLQTYGASVVVQRVLHCSPTAYVEQTVRELRPDPLGLCPYGLHTLSAWGQRTLVDGKRHVFSLHSVWKKLRRRWQQPRLTRGDHPQGGTP